MNFLINILHENKCIAEALKWSIEFGSEKNMYCEISENEDTIKNTCNLLLADPASFNRLCEKDKQPVCPVLILTTHTTDDFELAETLYKGIDAIADISEGPAVTLDKIKALLENKTDETQNLLLKIIQNSRIKTHESCDNVDYGLTHKEKNILKLMREANHLKLIAQLTNTSYETVRTHVKNIYKKIGVASASEAVIKALKMDLK
ncbi:MAG: LuxR C-terminal-related transcriptional regulator [Ferruginibacter sp.]|nr:LuxR C-terminal-related transcriptional regulator [Ferruginibacter sp.]